MLRLDSSNPNFVIGAVYKRSIIHDQYGGNRQSGISSSAKFPFIFIFSGKSGHQHGYKDEWINETVFCYTGEGQEGDMTFTSGNLSLLNHSKNNKRVFLFTSVVKSTVRYEGELELINVDFGEGHDRNGTLRICIRFFFKRVGVHLAYNLPIIGDVPNKSIDTPNQTERKGLVTSRVGQGAYRKSILIRWDFKCAVTHFSKAEVLIASHIVPWKSSTDFERLDVDNGILLSPTYDALFDQHFISFENNGKIIISDLLSKSNYNTIGVTGKETISGLSQGNISYLSRHRENLQ